MRTTIILDDVLMTKVRRYIGRGRGLSEFISQCVSEYFAKAEKQRLQKKLEIAYTKANKDVLNDDDQIDGWPKW